MMAVVLMAGPFPVAGRLKRPRVDVAMPRCRTYEPARRLTLSGPPTSLVVDEDHELEGGP